MTTPVNTGFTINPKLYDFLKFLALVLLPAVATFYVTLGSVWNFGGVTQVTGTIVAVDTLLGVVLGISSSNYSKQQTFGDLVFSTDEDGATYIKTLRGDVANPVFHDGGKVVLNTKFEHRLD